MKIISGIWLVVLDTVFLKAVVNVAILGYLICTCSCSCNVRINNQSKFRWYSYSLCSIQPIIANENILYAILQGNQDFLLKFIADLFLARHVLVSHLNYVVTLANIKLTWLQLDWDACYAVMKSSKWIVFKCFSFKKKSRF